MELADFRVLKQLLFWERLLFLTKYDRMIVPIDRIAISVLDVCDIMKHTLRCK